MIEITRQADLPGTPEQITQLLIDLPRWPDWFALHKGWVGELPTEAVPGAQFSHKVRVLGVPGQISWTVTELDIPTRFVAKGKGTSRTGADIDFRITEAPGGSHIAFTAKLTGMALLPARGVLPGWLDVRAERTIANLRALLAEDSAESAA